MYLTSRFSNMRYSFVILFLLLLACGTAKKSMTPKEYLNWYQSKDFGWKGMDSTEQIACAIRLFPKEIMVAKCAVDDCETKETLKERLASEEGTFDFLLELSSLKPGESIFDVRGEVGSSRSDRVLYFSNSIKNDIKGLTLSGDTVECTGVIYEPTLPQKARILINLEASKKSIVEIMITERIISGHAFHFKIPELTKKSIPSLKL